MPSKPLVMMDDDGLFPDLHPESYEQRKAQVLSSKIGTFDKELLYGAPTVMPTPPPKDRTQSSGSLFGNSPTSRGPGSFAVDGARRKRHSVVAESSRSGVSWPQTARSDRREGADSSEPQPNLQRRRSSMRLTGQGDEPSNFDSFLRGASPIALSRIGAFVKDNPTQAWTKIAELVDAARKTQGHLHDLETVLNTLQTKEEALQPNTFLSPVKSADGSPGGAGDESPTRLPSNPINASKVAEWERNTMVTVTLLDQLFGTVLQFMPSLRSEVEVVRLSILRALFVEGDTFAAASDVPRFETIEKCFTLDALHRATSHFHLRLWCVDAVKKKMQREKEALLVSQKTNPAVERVVSVLQQNIHSWRRESLRNHFRGWRSVRKTRLEEEEREREFARLRGEIEILRSGKQALEERIKRSRTDASQASVEFEQHLKDMYREIKELKEQNANLVKDNANLAERIAEMKEGESQTPLAKMREELHRSLLSLRETQRAHNTLREHVTELTNSLAVATEAQNAATGTVSEHNLLAQTVNTRLTARLKLNRMAVYNIGKLLDDGDGIGALTGWMNHVVQAAMSESTLQFGLRQGLQRAQKPSTGGVSNNSVADGPAVKLKEIHTFTEGALALLDAEAAILHAVRPDLIQTSRLVDVLLSSDPTMKSRVIADAAKEYLTVGIGGRLKPSEHQQAMLEWIDPAALEASSVRTHRLLAFELLMHWLVTLVYRDDDEGEQESSLFINWPLSEPGSPKAGTSNNYEGLPVELLSQPFSGSFASPGGSPSFSGRKSASEVEFKTVAEWEKTFRYASSLITVWRSVCLSLSVYGATLGAPAIGGVLSPKNAANDMASPRRGSNAASAVTGIVSADFTNEELSVKKLPEEKFLFEEEVTKLSLKNFLRTLPTDALGGEKPSAERIGEVADSILRDTEQYSASLASIFRQYGNLSSNSQQPALVLSPQETWKLVNDAGITTSSGAPIQRDAVRDVFQALFGCRRQITREAKAAVQSPTAKSLQIGGDSNNSGPTDVYTQFEVPLEEMAPLLLRIGAYINQGGPNPMTVDTAMPIFHRLVSTQLCGMDSRVLWADSTSIRQHMRQPEVKRVLDQLQKPLSVVFSTVISNQDSKFVGRGVMSQSQWSQFVADLKVLDDQSLTFVAVNAIYLHTQNIEYNKPMIMCFSEFVRGIVTLAWMKFPSPYIPLSLKVNRFYNAYIVPQYRKKLMYSMDAKSAEATGIAAGATPPQRSLSKRGSIVGPGAKRHSSHVMQKLQLDDAETPKLGSMRKRSSELNSSSDSGRKPQEQQADSGNDFTNSIDSAKFAPEDLGGTREPEPKTTLAASTSSDRNRGSGAQVSGSPLQENGSMDASATQPTVVFTQDSGNTKAKTSDDEVNDPLNETNPQFYKTVVDSEGSLSNPPSAPQSATSTPTTGHLRRRRSSTRKSSKTKLL